MRIDIIQANGQFSEKNLTLKTKKAEILTLNWENYINLAVDISLITILDRE